MPSASRSSTSASTGEYSGQRSIPLALRPARAAAQSCQNSIHSTHARQHAAALRSAARPLPISALARLSPATT